MKRITADMIAEAVAKNGTKLIRGEWIMKNDNGVCEACALSQLALANGMTIDAIDESFESDSITVEMAKLLELEEPYAKGFVYGFDDTQVTGSVLGYGSGEMFTFAEGYYDGLLANRALKPDRSQLYLE